MAVRVTLECPFTYRRFPTSRRLFELTLVGVLGLIAATNCTAATATEITASPTLSTSTAEQTTPSVPPTSTPEAPTMQLISTPAMLPTRESDDVFIIQLQSRQFVPEAGVESGLDLVRSASSEHVHVLVQLYDPPDATTKAQLESSGVKLLNPIPHNAWFASVPRTLQADDPAMSVIRWMGPILPEDKGRPELLKGQINTWALREGNTVALDVSLFEDVSLSEGEQVILGHGGVVVGATPLSNKLTVEIPKDMILPLVTEDIVRWIDVVPPPPVIHSEEG